MTEKNQTENFAFPLHRGRLFKVNGEWYFATRESTGHGPFVDYESAEIACREFVHAKRRGSRVRRVS